MRNLVFIFFTTFLIVSCEKHVYYQSENKATIEETDENLVSYAVSLVSFNSVMLKSTEMSGFSIKLFSEDTVITNTTDENGLVRFLNLEPGSYIVEISNEDYYTSKYSIDLMANESNSVSSIIPVVSFASAAPAIIEGFAYADLNKINSIMEFVPEGVALNSTVSSVETIKNKLASLLEHDGFGEISAFAVIGISNAIRSEIGKSGNVRFEIPTFGEDLAIEIHGDDFLYDQIQEINGEDTVKLSKVFFTDPMEIKVIPNTNYIRNFFWNARN